MAGAGKSTIGKLLAEATGKSYIDTDEMIESKTGKTPAGIINEYGEPHFRAIEKAVVKEAAARTSSVISTGGGAVPELHQEGSTRMEMDAGSVFSSPKLVLTLNWKVPGFRLPSVMLVCPRSSSVHFLPSTE